MAQVLSKFRDPGHLVSSLFVRSAVKTSVYVQRRTRTVARREQERRRVHGPRASGEHKSALAAAFPNSTGTLCPGDGNVMHACAFVTVRRSATITGRRNYRHHHLSSSIVCWQSWHFVVNVDNFDKKCRDKIVELVT